MKTKNQPMKTYIKNLFLLPALVAGLGLIPAGRVTAQTFTNLHSFTGSDGGNPQAGLILSGTTLYGTAFQGGSSGAGTVFAVSTDGTGFTNLHSFTYSDGVNPQAGLILSGNTLYGTAVNGGSSGAGTVFAVNTDGTGFTNLYSFTAYSIFLFANSDGVNPQAGLILSGNTLYGTAYGGGSGYGTVFAVSTDGTGFTNLHSFNYSDGANPQAGLILSGNTLYGTAYGGGDFGYGTVFAVNTDGTGFTNLHSFTYSFIYSDGVNPQAGLILSGNTLYGTAYGGGSSGQGTVFAVNTDGTGFTNLHSFTYVSDGANPRAGLILSGNTLYGTAYGGGSSGQGTVFSLSLGPHRLAGTVVAWGQNDYGQTTVPAGLSGVVTAIAAGYYHTVALKTNGTVVAWGYNYYGQTTVPAGLTNVTAIAAGFDHTVALKSDGTVVAWGYNADGETTVPAGLSGVTAIAAGHAHTVVLKSDGTVVAWGGGYSQTNVPAGLSGVTAIAAGGYHTVALKSDGTVVAWGNNSSGQMNVPAGLSGVTAIAAGEGHTVALKNNGTVVAWGAGTTTTGVFPEYGQSIVPAGLSGVTAIAAGAYHTVAIVGTAPQPQLTIIPSGANVILTWPANAAGFILQSTTNLVSPAVWITNSPAPVVVNGQNAVTNPVSGTQKFYRLSL
jgi:uncharacterized repeat protein (TIGR03803 family)